MMMSFYIGKGVQVRIFLEGAIGWTPEHLERIGEHLALARDHLRADLPFVERMAGMQAEEDEALSIPPHAR